MEAQREASNIALAVSHMIANGKSLSDVAKAVGLKPSKALFNKNEETVNEIATKIMTDLDVIMEKGSLAEKAQRIQNSKDALQALATKVNATSREQIDLKVKKLESMAVDLRVEVKEMEKHYYGKVLNTSKFASNEDLEGSNQHSILTKEKEMVTSFATKATQPDQIKMVQEELEFAAKIARDLNPGFGKSCELNLISQEISKKVLGMKPGDHLLLPGGYSQKAKEGGGHAVQYLIHKVDDKNFTFTVINTGEGLEDFHAKEEDSHYYDYKLANISQDKLTPNFFFGLMQLLVVTETFSRNINNVYAQVQSLGGERVTKKNAQKYGGLSTRKVQKKGICVYKSVAGYMKERLGSKDYHLYKLHSQDMLTKELEDLSQITDENQVRKKAKVEIDQMLPAGKTVREKRAGKVTKDSKVKDATRIVTRTQTKTGKVQSQASQESVEEKKSIWQSLTIPFVAFWRWLFG